MSAFDLVIRGGELVTASHRFRADIGVRDGRIAAGLAATSPSVRRMRLRPFPCKWNRPARRSQMTYSLTGVSFVTEVGAISAR